MGAWRGISTLILLLLFVGIVLWAYSARRKGDFDTMARLALEETEDGK